MRFRRYAIIAALALNAGAAVSFGALGSVISSFMVNNYWTWSVYAPARDSNYLYMPNSYYTTPVFLLYTRLPTGTIVRSPGLEGFGNGGFTDADASILGDGYYTAIHVVDSTYRLLNYRATDGSLVSSWILSGDVRGYAYAPGSDHLFLSTSSNIVRFTTTGSQLNSFAAPNTTHIAVTNTLAGRNGEYILASSGNVVRAYTTAGSIVTSFNMPGVNNDLGVVCGPGYPATNGTTLWCSLRVIAGSYIQYLFQLSLGNGINVEPSSLGRVKAIYR
jgi:hypothetical protein